VLANDISTGPGCLTSGRARLGNRVRLGTGIFMEPGLELGDDVQVASGSVILRSVPADHAVKTKIVTTTVVPRHR
jgi:acetyltransferase-like isoleucine patch superfamily enzyme